MGCDIHLHVEKRVDGDWTYWPAPEKQFGSMTFHNWFGERNYSLFAVLADVRNGYGFAGVDTGEGFIPIDLPRGLPEDVSPEVKKESDGWGVDGHSHTHFTLPELINYDYSQTTIERAFFDGKQLEEVDTRIAFWRKRDREDEVYLGDIYPRSGWSSSGEQRAWKATYRDSIGPNWFYFLLEMVGEGIKQDLSPADIRLVFWFDN